MIVFNFWMKYNENLVDREVLNLSNINILHFELLVKFACLLLTPTVNVL